MFLAKSSKKDFVPLYPLDPDFTLPSPVLIEIQTLVPLPVEDTCERILHVPPEAAGKFAASIT